MRTMTRREFGGLVGRLSSLSMLRGRAQKARDWETGRIAVPGGHVLWRAFGGGSRLPLLGVHGGHGPSTSSKPYETMFPLGDTRRLVTWDQLDCGESDHPRDPANWRLARYVEEMDVVRKTLVPGPVHIFGGSWGATLAMEWLVTKRPNVASVIFMCPGLDIPRAEESRRRAQQRLSPTSRATFDQLARTGKVASEALADATAEYTRTFIMRRPRPELAYGPPDLAIMKALGADLASWSRVAELRTLTQPVLFIRGEHDYVTEEDVNVFAAARPGSEVVTIPGAGHLAFLDDPDATNEAIRRFLLRVER